MKKFATFLFIELYIKFGLCTIHCNIKDDCSCVTGENLQITCPRNPVENTSHFVIHITENEEISINCSEMETFRLDLLPNITIDNINALKMNRCPLPQKGFKEILDWFNIKQIKVLDFESCPNKNIQLNKNDFEGLNDLENLTLNSLKGTTQIHENVFSNTPNLISLELQRNQKLNLTSPYIFKNTPLLKGLYMAKNSLVEIPDGLFETLKHLKVLHLWGNKLTRISELTFNGLVNLESLELKFNKITSVHKNAFESFTQILEISMTANKLGQLPENLFRNSQNLEKIYMVKNVGLKLPNYLFANLKSLKVVDLGECYLESVPEHVFANSTKLENLNLELNNLTHLSPGLFQGLVNLKILVLQKNLISEIEGDAFEFLPGLEEINLAHNSIRKIHHRVFYNKDNLRKINLSHNKYPVQNGTFQELDIVEGAPNIEEIDFSYNLITQVNQVVSLNLAPRLKKLDLRYNRIAEINITTLQSLRNFTEVKLDFNNITKINFQDIDNISGHGRSVISISHNPLECDCTNYDMFQYQEKNKKKMFDIRTENLKCATPLEMKGRSMNTLSSSALKCSLRKMKKDYKKCPRKCFCNWRPHDKSIVIDCSNKSLIQFPEIYLNEMLSLGFNQIEVHLEGNNLTVGPDRNTPGYSNVTQLYLSYNQIKTVTWLPPKLKNLRLDNNQISHLSSGVLKILNSSSLVNVTLEKNPWSCDCDAVDFANFLRQHPQQVVDAKHIDCFDNSRLLIDLTSSDLCHQWQIYLGVILLLVFLVIAVLFALYYRYQEELKIWLFAHNMCLWWVTEEELDKDKLYDAFISYSHKDEDFLVKNLLPVLEGGPAPYKLCLHFRDFIPGEFITTSVTNAVLESRRTLVLLSPNFLESVWGKMEFRTAHTQAMTEGRARVIIVLYGDVDMSSLDDELKAYIKTNTYVKWGDPYFWDKLKYALPHSRNVSNKNRKTQSVKIYTDDEFGLVKVNSANGASPSSTSPVLPSNSSNTNEHPLSFRVNSNINHFPAEVETSSNHVV